MKLLMNSDYFGLLSMVLPTQNRNGRCAVEDLAGFHEGRRAMSFAEEGLTRNSYRKN
jgi:hypothetical protein